MSQPPATPVHAVLPWVALGSALGSGCRVTLAPLLPITDAGAIPLGILTVNLIGSALAGVLLALTTRGRLSVRAVRTRHFLLTGFLGGFTTFSLFSLQAVELAEAGYPTNAFAYALLTLCGGPAAAWAGFKAASRPENTAGSN
ncbi:MAG: CrcB family protein [Opitutales bacterium]|nr:CrcB family protein [Opitutales bacterium]